MFLLNEKLERSCMNLERIKLAEFLITYNYKYNKQFGQVLFHRMRVFGSLD